MILCLVIVLTVVCVVVFVVCYKKKMTKTMEVKAMYCRGGIDSKNEHSSNGVFENDSTFKQDVVKFYGVKRGGRLESNSSTSSTMPLLFNRQNSIRSRMPSNGGTKLDSDLCEGKNQSKLSMSPSPASDP